MGKKFEFSGSVRSRWIVALCAAFVFWGLASLVAGKAVAGFIGVPIPYNLMAEQDCRNCHKRDSNIAKPIYNPDRHHLIKGTVPPLTDAPNSNPGDTFECMSCHALEFDEVSFDFNFVSFRNCLDCHQQKPGQDNTVHHRSSLAQTGDCAYCHVTPSFADDRPKQAACRECHGQYMHDNGGPIQDYGACVSCHNDAMTTAPASVPADSPATYAVPSPFHAEPQRPPGYTIIPEANGWLAGKGTFAIFWAKMTNNGDEEIREDVRPNGEDLNDEGGFFWRMPSLDYNLKRIESNGMYYDVPHFDDVPAPIQTDNPPVLSPQSPVSGQIVSGNVNISASASDDHAVNQVVYWIDQGSKVPMSVADGSQPGTWSATWDSRYIPSGTQSFVTLDGSHTISIQATDSQGQITTTTIPVNVQNSSDPVVNSPGNLALNKTLTASKQEVGYEAYRAADGNSTSRWWSRDGDNEWLTVDLAATYRPSKVVINWHSYYAREYEVQVSRDNRTWTRVKEIQDGSGGRDDLTFYPRDARYVRIYCKRASQYSGFSIYEVEVYQ